MKRTILRCLGVMLAVVLAAPLAAAQGALGTTTADVSMSVQPNTSLSWIVPSLTYFNGSVATSGVGLRNQRSGAITISGLNGTVQAAYVYWAVITYTTTIPAPVKGLTVARLWPTVVGVAASQTVTGTLVGKGISPCWGGAQILIYRAALNTATVALGNGVYKIQLKVGASGRTDGADPWNSTVTYPLFEGASLVFVGTGTSTVKIFDQSVSGYSALAGQTLATNSTSLDYMLWLSDIVTGRTIWHNIGADGQVGNSLLDNVAAQETTYMNGSLISGPGAVNGDSDWNGAIAGPLPQLWDSTAHDVSSVANGWQYLTVKFNTQTDCLTPVANVVEYK